jgi:hypothetical protein
MKYRTFRKLYISATVLIIAGLGWAVCGPSGNDAAKRQPRRESASSPIITPPPPAPRPALPAYAPKAAVTTDFIKTQVDAWLENNQDRRGQMKLVDFLPGAPFRATAIRFQDADAARFTSDPRNWSQIRIDRDRSGLDDEKWLLKNGRTYKREVLGPDSKTTVEIHYFGQSDGAQPSANPGVAAPVRLPAANIPSASAANSVKAQLDAWLANNQDRHGQMKLVNILPGASFRATAIRFPDADAAKFSSDPRNWSQIRLDLDRNGVDDEKWLIKNGRISKREVLGPDGKTTVQTEYFK